MAPWIRGALLSLAPPELLGVTSGRSHLLVPVSQDLSIDLLEAGLSEQERFVDAALDAPVDLPVAAAASDPYGVVLWPAAQVVAAVLVALLLKDSSRRHVLELGSGTGLCALSAAGLQPTVPPGGTVAVLATDYREEPLELLRQAVPLNEQRLGQPLEIATRCLDFTCEPLPHTDVLVAAGLLYLRSTSEALAAGCLSALQHGAHVLVGDTQRPGRPFFLRALAHALGKAVHFETVEGWSLVAVPVALLGTAGPPPLGEEESEGGAAAAALLAPVVRPQAVHAVASAGEIPWGEPKRAKTSLALLADEFTRAFQRTQWGVNGRVEPKFFDDNFVFRDPDVTTNGIQAYSKGTGAVLSNCQADAIDVQLFEPDRFAIRWRIAGTANVPFPGLRIKPYIVTSTFTVNSQGLVDSETDSFSIPTWDLLLSAVAPWLPGLAPPEPPVQSPYA
ncbi:Protein-lysine methyltransferase C42C1.13 [Durusdinium trenchii]|uniref:Protein-lysine methyltransferase C42C1.13 n=1 Tax=Durusdinium trenchii TaxID=1381693 RepID=A0ABP0KDD6_9DINO